MSSTFRVRGSAPLAVALLLPILSGCSGGFVSSDDARPTVAGSVTTAPPPRGSGTAAATASPGVGVTPWATGSPSAGSGPSATDSPRPMCAVARTARCVDVTTARRWWGSPLLLPQGRYASQFILQHEDARFAPGDAERHLPSSLALVLTFGGTSPAEAAQPAVLDAGGIVVLAVRTQTLQEPVHKETVRVRGHVATYGEATSVTTRKRYRYVQWSVRDGSHFVEWSVIDDARHRSLDALVGIVNDLGEA